MRVSTTVDDMEQISEQVVRKLFSDYEAIMEKLMPDGRPFMQLVLEDEDKIEHYEKLRGNPEAWGEFITLQTEEIVAKLQGLAPDIISAVHPVDVAIRMAIDYSSRMEAILGSQNEGDEQEPLPLPDNTQEDDVNGTGTDDRSEAS